MGYIIQLTYHPGGGGKKQVLFVLLSPKIYVYRNALTIYVCKAGLTAKAPHLTYSTSFNGMTVN